MIMNDYETAIAKIRSWTDAHFDAQGYCTVDRDDSRYYHKTPYLFVALGMRAKGARVAQRVMERFVEERGDIVEPPGFNLETRTYCMGWLALGGMVVERFDLAEALASRLAELQDPQTGAILVPDEASGEEVGDVCFSAGAGMGLVSTGRIATARVMADRLTAVLDTQPDSRRLYTHFRRDGSVIAKVKDPIDTRVYDLDKDERQWPVYFATTINVLVWVGRATRNKRYFDAARRYVDFVYRHRLDVARSHRTTKLGWGMVNLYEETGDEELLERVRHMGDMHVSLQSDDGLWDPDGSPGQPEWIRLSYSTDCAMTLCALAGLP